MKRAGTPRNECATLRKRNGTGVNGAKKRGGRVGREEGRDAGRNLLYSSHQAILFEILHVTSPHQTHAASDVFGTVERHVHTMYPPNYMI